MSELFNEKLVDEKMKAMAEDEPLTDQEAAEMLKVSPRTVQRLRLSKKLKSVRITSKISRITVRQVKDYLKQRAA